MNDSLEQDKHGNWTRPTRVLEVGTLVATRMEITLPSGHKVAKGQLVRVVRSGQDGKTLVAEDAGSPGAHSYTLVTSALVVIAPDLGKTTTKQLHRWLSEGSPPRQD